MRAYLILHVAALIGANTLFGRVTHPTQEEWLTPLLWLGFLLSTGASTLLFWALLKRSSSLGRGAASFALAWLVFYLFWSWSIVLASQAVHDRMIRYNEEPFQLFADTSGMQFNQWNADSHWYFLWATGWSCALSAVSSGCLYLGSRWARARYRRGVAGN